MPASVGKTIKQYLKNEAKVCGLSEPKITHKDIEPKVTRAEKAFLYHTTKMMDVRVWRHGWPDFLLQDRTTGEFYTVEIKQGKDKISPRQAETFAALEAMRIRVYIWNPDRHLELTPWRQYKGSYKDRTNSAEDVVEKAIKGL